MANAEGSGVVLTQPDSLNPHEKAVRIAQMWEQFNISRNRALSVGEEARQYVFALDVDTTSAAVTPHKNRTHQPKLTELSDNLQSQYWEATLALPDFFQFKGSKDVDEDRTRVIEAWIRSKLEQKKFRETIGRQLIADYVIYGTCFAELDYENETDELGNVIFKGARIRRISPLDIVFNAQAESFQKTPKITRQLVHVAEIADWPEQFPTANFKEAVISEAISNRSPAVIKDWVEVLKERGITLDGFSTLNEYFQQDLAEILIYRGDVFDPTTGELKRNQIVYVMDRSFVIRQEDSKAPRGFDGLHMSGWRIRNDNLWAQGPLDNLIGMQYRIDHLENLKADVFDQIAWPVVIIQGEDVQEPQDGFGPGAVYYTGIDESVTFDRPEAQALNADTQIAQYHQLMEQFVGSPAESRGIRTPGEKSAFEVSVLNENATKMFVDKAKNFEVMLERMLLEMFFLQVKFFDTVDYAEIFDDIDGEEILTELSREDVVGTGQFKAVGARHWARRNRETVEMRDFMAGPMQDPKIRAHINGEKLAKAFEHKLGWEDLEIIEPFAGVKEDVRIQAIAEEEAQRIRQEAGVDEPGEQEFPQEDIETGVNAITGEQVQPGAGTEEAPTEENQTVFGLQ